jgi:DNA-binding transcriptional MocR family regulator
VRSRGSTGADRGGRRLHGHRPRRAAAALALRDRRGRGVMRVGTFSKTVATGLRVGWIVAQPEITRAAGLHALRQRRLAAAAPHGAGLPANPARTSRTWRCCSDLYRERRDASAEVLRERCEPYVTFRTPARRLLPLAAAAARPRRARGGGEAAERGVAVTPGTGYFATPDAGTRVAATASAWSTPRCRRPTCARRSAASARRSRRWPRAPSASRGG